MMNSMQRGYVINNYMQNIRNIKAINNNYNNNTLIYYKSIKLIN